MSNVQDFILIIKTFLKIIRISQLYSVDVDKWENNKYVILFLVVFHFDSRVGFWYWLQQFRVITYLSLWMEISN